MVSIQYDDTVIKVVYIYTYWVNFFSLVEIFLILTFIDNINDWTWNNDSSDIASYTNWAEGDPNMNPYPDTNNVQLQQDYTTGSDDPIGTWFVPGDQIDSYSFICQSPKVPQSEVSTTTPGWDSTTTEPWWDTTTTTEPWWDTTTTEPWWDTTTTTPVWDTTTTEPWWDTTTTTEPWWDTTTTTDRWDTTTTPPWWDTTTTDREQSTTTPWGSMTCMEGYDDIVSSSGKCYYMSVYDEDMKTWEDAKDACSDRTNWNYDISYNNQNTLLVSINSAEENDELFSELDTYGADSSWIGLSWNGTYLFNTLHSKTQQKCVVTLVISSF